jgi:hypothetical protein
VTRRAPGLLQRVRQSLFNALGWSLALTHFL